MANAPGLDVLCALVNAHGSSAAAAAQLGKAGACEALIYIDMVIFGDDPALWLDDSASTIVAALCELPANRNKLLKAGILEKVNRAKGFARTPAAIASCDKALSALEQQ